MKAFDYVAPTSVKEAVSWLASKGDRARVLAGGTDLIVQLREGRRACDLVVDVKNIRQLHELSYHADRGLILGAAVPCWRIGEHTEIARIYPGLIDAVTLVGGVQIQGRATVGGNLCNGSPAADTIPPLIVYEGVCVIAGPGGTREVPVEKFCTGPGRTVLETGELLLGARLPPPAPHSAGAYLRFIPRNEMDIAVVGVGAAVTFDEGQTRCVAARVALAAVAPTPLLVAEVGTALTEGAWSETLLDRAAALAQAAARPISDLRGTAEYRRHLVGVLTRRVLRTAVERAKER